MKLFFKEKKSFLIIFFCILSVDIIFKNFDFLYKFRYISKLLITASLILHFYYNSHGFLKNERILVLLALFFSFVADFFLIDSSNILFMGLGMFMFILAKVSYSIFYSFKAQFNVHFFWPFLGVAFLYYFFVTLFLYDGLGNLFIPALIYVLASVTMIKMAFLRNRNVNNKSYIFVLIGAFLFLAAETILSINSFYTPVWHANVTLMLSYGLSQLFTIRGIILQKDPLD